MKNDLEIYIRQCIENDRGGQLKIYQLFSPVLYGICLKYMKNEDDAKDVFQESFIIAFQKIHQYKFEGSFEGWLKRIFINKLIETLNKKKKESFFLDVFDPETDFIEEDELEICTIPQEKLLEYIQDLPDQYRLVFNLYVFEKNETQGNCGSAQNFRRNIKIKFKQGKENSPKKNFEYKKF